MLHKIKVTEKHYREGRANFGFGLQQTHCMVANALREAGVSFETVGISYVRTKDGLVHLPTFVAMRIISYMDKVWEGDFEFEFDTELIEADEEFVEAVFI
jgi:hypothetical protein